MTTCQPEDVFIQLQTGESSDKISASNCLLLCTTQKGERLPKILVETFSLTFSTFVIASRPQQLFRQQIVPPNFFLENQFVSPLISFVECPIKDLIITDKILPPL